MNNMPISDNAVLESTRRELARRLPSGWRIETVSGPLGASLRFVSGEGRSRSVPVALNSRINPRAAREMGDASAFVVAPYLSPSVRAALQSQGLSYADPTGNIRVVLDEPGLFILTSGATKDPTPKRRRLSLRGAKAGRVVRALIRLLPPRGVRELAALTGTDPGYVSRLLAMLDSEALVDRSSRGRVERVDWRRLIARWSEDAPLTGRAEASTWLAPRGLGQVYKRLASIDFRYLITGSAAASYIAPVAPTRLLSIYVDDANLAAASLGLRPTDSGANVVLLQPDDSWVFEHADESGELHQPELSIVVADLLNGPGRSPAEAEALMDWMQENEAVWHG